MNAKNKLLLTCVGISTLVAFPLLAAQGTASTPSRSPSASPTTGTGIADPLAPARDARDRVPDPALEAAAREESNQVAATDWFAEIHASPRHAFGLLFGRMPEGQSFSPSMENFIHMQEVRIQRAFADMTVDEVLAVLDTAFPDDPAMDELRESLRLEPGTTEVLDAALIPSEAEFIQVWEDSHWEWVDALQWWAVSRLTSAYGFEYHGLEVEEDNIYDFLGEELTLFVESHMRLASSSELHAALGRWDNAVWNERMARKFDSVTDEHMQALSSTSLELRRLLMAEYHIEANELYDQAPGLFGPLNRLAGQVLRERSDCCN